MFMVVNLLDGLQERLPVGDLVRDPAEYALQRGGLFVQLLEGVLGAVQAVFDHC